ncbi:hypothetical protein AQUCO_01100076v1 [Aquilegia coerulea]|uniref:Uncharacterized protein n=1 Tax=Aquilegia coerulea TaxID=218851 RepID=A0A2G5E5H9_AQUCA|nr:hypothetical protein AQUCO_01100076v1 [Aquilegia coerulea]
MQATRLSPNTTSICISVHSINSKGWFNGHDSLKYSTPILLLQLSIASFTAIITSALLKPIGIPVMVSQIFAGIFLGPTCLGRIQIYLKKIFPFRSFLMLDTYATFGTIFQLFLVGVQMNPMLILNAGRKAIVIGVSVVILPLIISITSAILITANIEMENYLARSLMIVGIAESMTAFPVIAAYLSELNILNLEVSRVAFSSSMISGLLCFSLVTTIMLCQIANNAAEVLGMMALTTMVVLAIIMLVLRPLVNRMIKRVPEGQTVKEGYLCAVFLMVLLLAYVCRLGRLHMLFGPFVFGTIIPSGPPLGTALVDRLEYVNAWLIMPIFYTVHGMTMDVFKVQLKNAVLVQSIILITCTAKFLGAFLPAVYYSMSYKDAALLGLTMNTQGFLELSLFKMLSDIELIDYASYEILCASMVFVTGGLTPVVRYLYKSSIKYKLHNRRTIQHSEPNGELRVMACIYEEENVPSIIHLLKATNPTKDSPINASIVHFVELVGRATPLIISHKTHRKPTAAGAVSQRIITVFKRYEENNRGSISVHPYTVVSPYASMHNDVCMLALHKRSTLIILPFHKQFATGIISGGIKTVNCNVLEKSPCSVGILIDRGLLGGIKFVLANWLSYHVAVVFLGGADDREALALGARMSEHPTIELTVIQFLAHYRVDSDPVERSLDDEMVNDFKYKCAYNNRVVYIEEDQVKNGIGVINVFEAMADRYELIILGRRHDENSPLILELTEWNKSELGTMGDIFTTSGYGGKATILVVQQQTKVAAQPRDSTQGDEEEMQSRSQIYDSPKEEELPFRKDDI